MPFAKRIAKLNPSITLAVDAKAKALKAQGLDVVGFGAGEPDFDTPPHIRDAAIKGLNEGLTRYTPAAGMPQLRQAVADFYQNRYGLPASPKNVAICCGAKHALYNVFQLLLDPGDEVIIPAPYWVSYPEMVWLAEGEAVILPTDESTSFRLSAEQLRAAVTPRTKVLVLNSPSNPTGATYSRRELEAIAAVAREKNFWVIADEIYEYLVYDGFEFVSFPTVGKDLFERTIIISGASKTYAMTGWRIGWAVGPEPLIEMMSRLLSQSTSNATSFAQAGAIAALKGSPEIIQEMVAMFAKRRNVMVEFLRNIPGVECFNPEGAFYVFPKVSSYYGKTYKGKTIDGSLAMCEYLLDAVQVAAVPGIGFGQDANIRLSYATSMDQIEKGLERIRRALLEL